MTNSNHDATKNSLDDGISETNVCQLKMNLNDNRWHSPLLIPLEVLFELLTLKLLHFLLFRSYCKKYKKHRSGSWTPTVEIPWKHLLPTYSTLYYVTDTLYPGRYSGVAGYNQGVLLLPRTMLHTLNQQSPASPASTERCEMRRKCC